MALSGDGWNHGTGSKTTDLGGASPGGSTPTGGYIKVSPVNIESFTISTNLGILTKSDFVLTGTYYEYYNVGLQLIQSVSSTGYTASISRATSHGDLVFEVIFHPTRLYAWTDSILPVGTQYYAWTLNDTTIYTTTITPTSSDKLYDENENDITNTDYGNYGNIQIMGIVDNQLQIAYDKI